MLPICYRERYVDRGITRRGWLFAGAFVTVVLLGTATVVPRLLFSDHLDYSAVESIEHDLDYQVPPEASRRRLVARSNTRKRPVGPRSVARRKGGRFLLPVDTYESRAGTYIAASTHPSKGSDMFTRIVSMTLKPNVAPQFSQLLEQKLVPALRKEPGFQDEMLFVVPGGPEVVAISVWKTREDLENYARGAYRKVLGMLETLIEKEPRVEVYQLAYSTIHRTGLSEFPKQSPNTTPPAGVGG